MTVWTIYQNPSDYPVDKWVVRGWKIRASFKHPQPMTVHVFDTLEEARLWIAQRHYGAYQLPGQAEDDPVIVETWI